MRCLAMLLGLFAACTGPTERASPFLSSGAPRAYVFTERGTDRGAYLLASIGRPYSVRIPIAGGPSALSADGGQTWAPLYDLTFAATP